MTSIWIILSFIHLRNVYWELLCAKGKQPTQLHLNTCLWWRHYGNRIGGERKERQWPHGPRVPHPPCPITAGHRQWHNQDGICPTAWSLQGRKVIPLLPWDSFGFLPVIFPSKLILILTEVIMSLIGPLIRLKCTARAYTPRPCKPSNRSSQTKTNQYVINQPGLFPPPPFQLSFLF